MMYLAPIPLQYVDASGVPYSGGTVEVYYHSNPTKLANVYLDAKGEEISENPVRLDSNGSWVGFVPSGIRLNYIVKDKDGNVVFSYNDISINRSESPSPSAESKWGHWVAENPFIPITSSREKAIGESLEFVDGNIEGQTTSIVPGKGAWHFDLELAFQGPSTHGYVKYDLKVYSGNTPLRAISFGFQNLTEVGNFLSQWIGGIIECDEDEAISFTIKRISGSLNANLGISNFFIHKV